MNTEIKWDKYLCRACGLIYDEALGDPDSGLAPGTRFDDIPDDWECPLCGVTKQDFELLSPQNLINESLRPDLDSEDGVLVLGAGIAGWSVVDALRQLDPTLPITMVSACAGDVYHKPELSVSLSRNKSRNELIQELGTSKAVRLGVHLLSHTFVVAIDARRRCLRTTRGEISYRQLVIAQGAKASVPSVIPKKLAWRVNHLDAWSALQHQLGTHSQSVAVLGSGLIGCEIAEDLLKAGHAVHLISRDALPLKRLLPVEAARRLLKSLKVAGADFIGLQEVTAVEELAKGKKRIDMLRGNSIEVDHLIVATGLETDSRLAKQANLVFDQGISVDPNSLKTSDDNIFALGDCISLNGHPCRFIEPIKQQARVIAQNILGINTQSYQHSPPIIRLKNKILAVELHGTPIANDTWKTLFSSDECLIMEQYQEGMVSSRLNMGAIPPAYKNIFNHFRGSQL